MRRTTASAPYQAELIEPDYEDSCALVIYEHARTQSDSVNLAVLGAVAVLDAQPTAGSHDETDVRHQDLLQLDQKMNVLIQMFAGFWRQQCDLPSAVPVRVRTSGVEVEAAVVQMPSNPRELVLYLHEALPQPLILPLAQVRQHDGKAGPIWTLQFGALSEELKDALARHVFRRHRRAVAQRKQNCDVISSE